MYTAKQQKYASLVDYPEDYVARLRRFKKVQVLLAINWFSVNDAPNAQSVDLQFIKDLYDYKGVDKPMASACLETALNHLQFLAPEFVFLSLVSNRLPLQEKADVAAAILSCAPPPKDKDGNPQFAIQVSIINMAGYMLAC